MDSEHKTDTKQIIKAMFESSFVTEGESWEDSVQQEMTQVQQPDLMIPEPDSEGNFTSPVLARIKQSWADLDAGKVTQDQVSKVLDEAFAEIEERIEVMNMMAKEGDNLESPINQLVLEGFEMHKEAIDIMDVFFEDHDRSHIKEGINLLQKATNQLMEGFEKFKEAFMSSLSIFCPKCNTENIKNSEKCYKCGTVLPREIVEPQQQNVIYAEEGFQPGDMVETTPNYDQVEDAIMAWKARQINDDELKREIIEVDENFLAFRQDMVREQKDIAGLKPKEKEIFSEICRITIEAIDENLKAISNIKEYFEDKNPNHLDVGLKQLAEATQSIIMAYNINEEVRNQANAQQKVNT